MTETVSTQALLRLMAWMSPAFPVGAFSYSSGLERAVHDGHVSDQEDLSDWLTDLLTIGSVWNDAVLFAASWRECNDGDNLTELSDLAEAMAGSAERHLETVRQGSAFLKAAKAWPDNLFDRLPPDCPLPVVAGAVAGAHGIPLTASLSAYLHAFLSNQVQAAQRLMPLGQQAGVEILARLERIVEASARNAAISTLDDLGSATINAEIASLRHETQLSRLFRS